MVRESLVTVSVFVLLCVCAQSPGLGAVALSAGAMTELRGGCVDGCRIHTNKCGMTRCWTKDSFCKHCEYNSPWIQWICLTYYPLAGSCTLSGNHVNGCGWDIVGAHCADYGEGVLACWGGEVRVGVDCTLKVATSGTICP